MTKLDLKRGCLIGLAVGDALGAAVEFQPPGTFEPVTSYRAGGPHQLNAGEWTDDTSMALALADSIANVGWDLNDQMIRYLRWFRFGDYSVNGKCFDIGMTTRRALVSYERSGDPYRSASNHPKTAGNGSIMRLAPIVIKYVEKLRYESIVLAEQSSFTTHSAKEATEACAYLMLFLQGLMATENKEYAFNYAHTPSWSGCVLGIADGSFLSKNPPEIKGSGYVIESLEAALWAFWHSDNFEEAVLKAVNLGDDADTTGAVCGQLAGALWGESGIPQHLRDGLARMDMVENALVGLGC